MIGGGLAGITAAIALAESGADVTLLEARPRLGGATCSFSRDGLTVDTGQHVFLGCCSAYRGLLARLGMTEHTTLQDRFDVTVLAPGPTASRARPGSAGPRCLARCICCPRWAGIRFFLLTERASVARPALAMRFVDPADPAADTQRFGDWLAQRGQDERTRRALWDLFSVSALNIAGDDASLALAAVVVKTGLLGKNNAADIGVPALPLGELHGDAGATLLAKLGAQVTLSAKVSAIEHGAIEPADGGGYRVRLAEDELTADAVVLAVPHEKAAPLIPAGALPEQTVAGWAGLGASPIVNVHVIYDRPVMDLPFVAAIDSPVQWVFDRTASPDLLRRDGPPGQQYLAISLSAADQYADTPAAKLREQFLPALAELFPAARDARVTEFFVTRERRATFRQAPGSGALRPKAATARPGLVLAGAWTDTGWPDTMEGAVRSGLAAAAQLKASLSTIGVPQVTAVMPEGVALARDLVGPAMEAAIARLTPDVRAVAAYHLGFADAAGNPIRSGSGKALRPALALLSARAAGAPPERGVTAAVAVELVHNFSLLHDDIMDNDTERRHRPTAWTVFGVGAAILAGDGLLALAQDLLLEDDTLKGAWAARCLSAAVLRLIGGQGSDLAFEKRDDVTLAECLDMAGDKTAALMACACSIGAVHLGAPPALAMGLAGFGAHVGLAFQLTDDLLGIWGAPEITGKPVRADLRARKKSLPVVAALNSGTPEAAGLRALLTSPEALTEDDLVRAANLVVAAGGKDWAESEADAQLAAANASLADIDLPADVRAELTAIAEFITARTW